MSYKIALGAGSTVKQMTDERAAAKSGKRTEDDRASMRLFGFTNAEAINAIERYATTSSPDPVSDVMDHMPTGVLYRAYDLVESLDLEGGDGLVYEAMDDAKSPKDFWTRLSKLVKYDEPLEDE